MRWQVAPIACVAARIGSAVNDRFRPLVQDVSMEPNWSGRVGLAMRRLMDVSGIPTHDGLDDAFASVGMTIPRDTPSGESITKPRRMRTAFETADSNGLQATRRLISALVDELRHRDVFQHPAPEIVAAVQAVRQLITEGGATLTTDGFITTAVAFPTVDAGQRETVDRLIARLRRNDQDPASILGTAKDLLEATSKHVLHERAPQQRQKDMPNIVYEAMEALDLSTKPSSINGPSAGAIAQLHQLIARTAQAVTASRNDGGDGHGHLNPTGVSPELAEYVRVVTLAATKFLLDNAT